MAVSAGRQKAAAAAVTGSAVAAVAAVAACSGCAATIDAAAAVTAAAAAVVRPSAAATTTRDHQRCRRGPRHEGEATAAAAGAAASPVAPLAANNDGDCLTHRQHEFARGRLVAASGPVVTGPARGAVGGDEVAVDARYGAVKVAGPGVVSMKRIVAPAGAVPRGR